MHPFTEAFCEGSESQIFPIVTPTLANRWASCGRIRHDFESERVPPPSGEVNNVSLQSNGRMVVFSFHGTDRWFLLAPLWGHCVSPPFF